MTAPLPLARRSAGTVAAAAPGRRGRTGRTGRLAGVVLLGGAVVLAAAGCGDRTRPVALPEPLPAPTPTVTAAPVPGGGQRATPEVASPRRHRPGGAARRAAGGTHPATPPATDRSRGTVARRLAGLVVVLDPGHNGGNAAHPDIINRSVPAGLGQTKACNTVGAETAAGYPEHAFNFDVALRARRLLAARGLTVLLTRADDVGVGPCVDARAQFGNAHAAAAVVSIHGDGADAAGTGFHVIEPGVPQHDPVVAGATHDLALAVRAALLAESGLGYATYTGGGQGLDHRSDLAGLNLSTRPAILVECGNMRNAADAAKMTSPAGRQRIARALADGILAALAS